MTKQERINAVAAALEHYKDTVTIRNKPMTDRDGNSYGWHYAAEIDCEELAAQLVEEGFGNLREFKSEIINLYLKGDITGLLKVLQEEI